MTATRLRKAWLGWALVFIAIAAAVARWSVQAPVANAAPMDAAPPAPPAIGLSGPVRIALVAGDGHVGHRDGAGAQARFADPYGLALDASGALYVGDAGDNNRIRRIAPDGSVSTVAGGAEGWRDGPAGEAAFHTPSGLAVDAQGNLYIADTGNHAVRKLAPDGTVSTLAGNGVPGFRDGAGAQAQFNGPLAVAVDAQGRVLVADTYNDRIRAITPDGQVSTLAGGEAPGFEDGPAATARFDTPCGLAVDGAGTVWVADTRNNAIRKIDRDGIVSTFVRREPDDALSLLRRPLSVVVAADHAVYVGVGYRGALLQVTPAGAMRTLVGDGNQRLVRPAALAVDGAGRLLLSDAGSARIHRIDPLPEGAAPAQADALGPAVDRALPDTQRRWPLQPQRAWHEVVGTQGEVRGNDKGERLDHFHDGLDVRGDVGQPVHAIADAKVSNPVGTWSYGRLGEGIAVDGLSYVHVRVGRDRRGGVIDTRRFQLLRDAAGKPERVRVRRGTRFLAGDVLGTVNGMAHVHLSLGASGYERSPMVLGFEGFSDRLPPHVEGITLVDAAGQPLRRRAGGRLLVPRDGEGVQIVVDAWDQVDGNLPRRRLGLQALGFQILQSTGQPAAGFEQPRITLDFTTLPPDDAAVALAYAADSGITVNGSKQTRFLYQLANTVRDGRAGAGRWQASELPPGDYTLRVFARDHAGNVATRGTDMAVRLE